MPDTVLELGVSDKTLPSWDFHSGLERQTVYMQKINKYQLQIVVGVLEKLKQGDGI